MTGNFARSLLTAFSRSYAASSSSVVLSNSTSLLCRLRPLISAANSSYFGRIAPGFSTMGFATRPTTSSLNDPNPNWSNRPPKETILLDGCDFEHWLVVMEKPEGEPTRDEIIDSYIKTLAMVVGSEEEARMKIYSVSTRHYFAFGALVSEELSYKIKELPKVRWVLPDSYLNVKEKDYGGEPFINGQAVPYDPKYHEEWVRNNARANERNKRNDRPRNFDRSRNFERRREMQMGNQNSGGSDNMRGQPNMGGQPNYGTPNSANYPTNNFSGGVPNNNPSSYPGPNTGGPNHQQGFAPNMGPSQGHNPNIGSGFQNQYVPGRDMAAPPNNPNIGSGYQNQRVPGSDMPVPPNNLNMGSGYQNQHVPRRDMPAPPNNPNMGSGYQNQYVPGRDMSAPPNNPNMGSGYQNQYVPGRDMPAPPSRDPSPGQTSGYGPSRNNYAPNMGYQGGYAPNAGPAQGRSNDMGSGNAHQTQNIPGRDSHY